LVLIGIWWGEEIWQAIVHRKDDGEIHKIRRIIIPGIIFGITALACLLNPQGIGIIGYLKTLTSNSVVQNLVIEWAPPTLSTAMGTTFLCGLMASAILLALSPKRSGFFEIITFLVFGFLGLKTSRGSVWFGLVMAPIIATHLSAIVTDFPKAGRASINQEGSKVLNFLFACVIIVMGVISLPWFKSILPMPAAKAGLISAETPIKGTQVLLEKNLPGRVFNSMSFGSYLIWEAYPQYQDFVDPRIELFSENVWLDYLNISNANGDWETKLRDYGVNTLILSPDEQPALVEAARVSDDWEIVYQDGSAIIFERN
jgi:hypothetical protein